LKLSKTARAWWTAKHGCAPGEYEDAIALSPRHGRFAVADGASASAFARLWAQLLVRAYVRGTLRAATLEHDLEPLQAQWASSVESRDLPWYAQEQVRRGAFAAVVGLTISEDHTWRALAVGDCCVFHLHNHRLQRAFPLTAPEQFTNQPLLIGSRPAANARLRSDEAIRYTAGAWSSGDAFLLMSDALAATFLHRECLDFKPTRRGFSNWVKTLRERELLRNDDVSLLHILTICDATA
jgi:serine/threonine protein phosphatase PrpC